MVFQVVVQGDIGFEPTDAAPGRKHQGRIKDGRDHVELPALDGGGVRVDLEGGTRLAGCISHIDPSARTVVVVASNHREDLTRLRVHADQRGVVKVVVVALLRDLVAHHLLGDVLQIEVE